MLIRCVAFVHWLRNGQCSTIGQLTFDQRSLWLRVVYKAFWMMRIYEGLVSVLKTCIVQRTVYSVQWNEVFYIIQCIMNYVQFILQMIHIQSYSSNIICFYQENYISTNMNCSKYYTNINYLRCTLYRLYCTLYTIQCILYSVHCSVYGVYCTFRKIQYITILKWYTRYVYMYYKHRTVYTHTCRWE